MRIRDLREDHDLTQKEVAEYLHIKQNTYSQYENGQRQLPLDCLVALAKLYQTSTDYILGLTDKKERLAKRMTKISFKRAFSLLFAFACVFSTLLFTSCGECEHVWDEGKVAKEPTDTQEGAMIYTCLECQEQRYEAIKKLTHNPKSHTYDKAIWGKDSTHHWLICDHPDCDVQSLWQAQARQRPLCNCLLQG